MRYSSASKHGHVGFGLLGVCQLSPQPANLLYALRSGFASPDLPPPSGGFWSSRRRTGTFSFFLSPPAHLHLFLPRLTRSISFHAFIHVLERSYYYYYIRYNAPTTTSISGSSSFKKRPPPNLELTVVVRHWLTWQGRIHRSA